MGFRQASDMTRFVFKWSVNVENGEQKEETEHSPSGGPGQQSWQSTEAQTGPAQGAQRR